MPAISVIWLTGTEQTPAPTASPVAVTRASTAIPPAAMLIRKLSTSSGLGCDPP